MWANSTCYQLSRPCRQCSPMLSGVPVTPLCSPPSHFHLAAQLFLYLFQSQLLLFSIVIDNFLTARWRGRRPTPIVVVNPLYCPSTGENPELAAILGNCSFSRAECFHLGWDLCVPLCFNEAGAWQTDQMGSLLNYFEFWGVGRGS